MSDGGIERVIERAAIKEKEGNLAESFVDIRTALSIDSHNTQAKASLERLLAKLTVDASPLPLTELVSRATDDDREAAQSLAVRCNDESVCLELCNGDGELLSSIIKTVALTQDAEDDAVSQSNRFVLLRVIASVASVAGCAISVLECIDREILESNRLLSFLGNADTVSVRIAADSIATCVCNSLSAADDRVAPVNLRFCMAVARLLAGDCVVSRHALACSLIKSLASQSLVLQFLFNSMDSDLFTTLFTATDHSVPLLAKCLGMLDADNQRSVIQTLRKTVDSLLDASDATKKAQGLLLLAAVCEAQPALGTEILQTESLLESIVDTLEFEASSVQTAALRMLSTACNHPETRKLVSTHSTPFLLTKYRQTTEPFALWLMAVLPIAKIMSSNNKTLESVILKDTRIIPGCATLLQTPYRIDAVIETLAYLSMYPVFKNQICACKGLVESLCLVPKAASRPTQFGVATILFNLTAYPKQLTKEEQQVKTLQAMTASNQQPQQDFNEDTSVVSKRIQQVVKFGCLATLNELSTCSSQAINDLVASVFLAVSMDKSLRGLMVQQGSCRTLLSLTKRCSKDGVEKAAQALARVGITSDPCLAFKGQMVFEIVRPLLDLCRSQSLLAQFEALLALTNIAGTSDAVRVHILSLDGLKQFEVMLFCDHVMVRRAAIEAICNMVFLQRVFDMYVEEASSADSRTSKLRMVTALCDSEDFETRRAASGCLAILSSTVSGAKAVSKQNRVVEILGELLESGKVELVHRGVETVKNLLVADSALANRFVDSGLVRQLLRIKNEHSNHPEILQSVLDAFNIISKK